MQAITITTTVHATLELVWQCWTDPAHITHWNQASSDWHCSRATNDLRVGGSFSALMAAKDNSVSFEFAGTYTEVVPEEKIAYTMADGRSVTVNFTQEADAVIVTETFDPETENTLELQRSGWQAILDNFKTYVEAQ